MPRKLKKIVINEISLVDTPANGVSFKIFKRAGDKPVPDNSRNGDVATMEFDELKKAFVDIEAIIKKEFGDKDSNKGGEKDAALNDIDNSPELAEALEMANEVAGILTDAKDLTDDDIAGLEQMNNELQAVIDETEKDNNKGAK